MKKIVSIMAIASAILISGCAQVKADNIIKYESKGPLVCKEGSKYSPTHDKCVVMNFDLNGVIESKECNESKCTAIVLDERSRRIKIEADSNINIGDRVSVILYKKGEQTVIKSDTGK